MRQIERLDFRIRRPRESHTRPATCEEVECEAYRSGWASTIDERTEIGQRQAQYIRKQSGRSGVEERTPDGLTRFLFRPGQPCFTQHRVDIEREPIFLALSTHRTARRHTAATWQEDHATEIDRLRTFQERHG